MSKILIGHAVGSENNSNEGKAGDQTGKEIRIANWYDRPWDTVIVPRDADMADAAADFMERICESPLYGYSRKNRTAGYKAILKAGGDVENSAGGDFDCSSLCCACYIFAGSKVTIGYTGSMERIFRNSDEFDIYKDADHLHDCQLAKRGTLYLSTGHHVCMALDDGERSGDKKPYVRTIGSIRVRDYPCDGKVLGIARNAMLPYLGTDEDTGWYNVEYKGSSCWVTGKPKYTEVVYQ